VGYLNAWVPAPVKARVVDRHERLQCRVEQLRPPREQHLGGDRRKPVVDHIEGLAVVGVNGGAAAPGNRISRRDLGPVGP